MDDFIQAIELALATKNWHAALIVALCVPDICGYLEHPGSKSECRYERWFKRYLLPKYRRSIGAEGKVHTFLSPSDFYALRCALSHEGRDSIIEQRARVALDRFHFVIPPRRGFIHCNQFNNTLQLQIDEFCKEIIGGVRQWLKDVKGNQDVDANMKRILRIYTPLRTAM